MKKEVKSWNEQNKIDKIKEMSSDFHAGCSSFSWSTLDGKHLWGRNFDFNRIADGSKVTYIPRGTTFYTCGSTVEHNIAEETYQTATYAAIGIGLLLESTPTLYEGMNEKGLMGGQLYYREFAHFKEKGIDERLALQPPFAVTYFLTKCATVEEVVAELEQNVAFVGIPLLGTVPPIHWTFSDKTGETIIIEPDREELHIYRKTMGVMTNSPSYSWHRLNLLNYAQIREFDYDELVINGEKLSQCFSGSGAFGMPGDWSSTSRFIRLSFLKKYAVQGRNEEEGVTNMFHLFQSVAFPLGMIKVSDQGKITEKDTSIVPYDYTVYTSVMCAESLKFYWNSYKNMRVQYVDLAILMNSNQVQQFELDFNEDFKCRNEK